MACTTTAAANWAVVNGYITGIDNLDGTFDFAADKPVSFEQMVTHPLGASPPTPDEVARVGEARPVRLRRRRYGKQLVAQSPRMGA